MYALGLALMVAALDVYTVKVKDSSTLAIEFVLKQDNVPLCLEMPGAHVAISEIPAHPQQAECFTAARGRVRYEVHLDALQAIRDDPDYAAKLGPAWLFHDAAVFLRPEGSAVGFQVRFELPEHIQVATPWPQNAKSVFTVSAVQFDAGAYIALGPLRTLGLLQFHSFSARVTLVEQSKAASDAQLLQWVQQALSTLHRFYRGALTKSRKPIHIVLANVPSEEPGVFGSTLRRGIPSVMLLYGDKATRGFERDWVAMHELFHLGNPPTVKRYPWLVEGLTTYYTEVLRARIGALTEAELWGNLSTQLKEYCQPNGKTLQQHSEGLPHSHDWQRVYWNGACLALRLDVAMRHATKNRRCLDDVMRALQRGSRRSESEVVAIFDEAAGSALASRHLTTTDAIPIDSLLHDLGVGEVLEGKAMLDERAPLAHIRRGILVE